MFHWTVRVESSTRALSELSTNEISQIRRKIDEDLKHSEIISGFSILLMILSIAWFEQTHGKPVFLNNSTFNLSKAENYANAIEKNSCLFYETANSGRQN